VIFMADEHIIEAIGMTRMIIRDGIVVETGEPKIRSCPLAKRFATPVDPITRDGVNANISTRIQRFGMCTRDRIVLDKETFVLFGASELMNTGLRTGTLEAVVIACDGAGTVIVRSPEMVQGIGGRMSGLVSTTPHPEVIKRIEAEGGIVINPQTAAMDALKGLAKTKEMGWTRTAVTIAGFQHELAEKIREKYPDALIIAVHTSSVTSLEDAKRLVKASDLIFSCASKYVREAAASAALVQGGVRVPVFATSKAGKMLIMEQLIETEQPILVKNAHLPVINMGDSPEPLI
jgi:putative methanogenesis marker protein 8